VALFNHYLRAKVGQSMSTLQVRPEILVVGFSHLIWLTLLTLDMLGVAPCDSKDFILKIEPGLAVVLISLAVGVSFFLGTLSEHIMIVCSHCMMGKRKRIKKLIFYKDNPYLIWGAKSFFRSMSLSGLGIIIILLILDNKYSSDSHYYTMLTIGGILEVITFITCLFWNYIDRKVS
jgi:hypothetical protein